MTVKLQAAISKAWHKHPKCTPFYRAIESVDVCFLTHWPVAVTEASLCTKYNDFLKAEYTGTAAGGGGRIFHRLE